MRIRSIKPEFWRSDDIDALCIEDRLLFIGLWSYVDDSGVGVDKPSSIAADLFAGDLARDPAACSVRVHGGLKRLCAAGLITRYTVRGRRFLHITTWSRHQKINRPTESRFPGPTSDDAELTSNLTEDSVSPHAPEQGNRGTGEQGIYPAGHVDQPGHAEYRASARDDRTPAQRALDRVGTAHSPDAHRLITAWTSTLRRRPPAQVVSKLAAEADVLLAEQQWTDDEIRAGLDEWNRKGLSPTLLPSVMHELHSSDDPDRPVHLPTDPAARLTPEQVEEIIGDYAQMPLEPEELTRSDKAAERRAWIRENTAKWEAEREQQAREILRRRASMRTAG